MSISMHSASVPIFVRTLNSMLVWLDKAEAYAETRGFDVDNYVGLRLAPDMLPFSRQIQIASDATKSCVARLAGLEPPKWADDETTLDELRARIRKTIEFAESVPASDLEGTETQEIQIPMGPDQSITLAGEFFLKHFALPNFFFHATMTYALLRQGGVQLGKMDFLGAP